MKNISIFFAIILFPFVTVAQGEVLLKRTKIIENNYNFEPDKNYHFKARDFIELQPGFEFDARTNNKTFTAEIDPNLLFLVDYDTEIIEWSNDFTVGSLPGSVDVGSFGGASYQIPIAVPSGTSGVQPSLGISYSSQAGDGLLGMGWTITGLSPAGASL